MSHGLEYGVSDTGKDLGALPVKTLTLGHGDTIQNLDTNMRIHYFTYGSCNFKLIFQEYFNS